MALHHNTQTDNPQTDFNFFNKIRRRDKLAFSARYICEHFFAFKSLTPLWRKWDQSIQANIYHSVKWIQKIKCQIQECDSTVDPASIRKEYVKKGIPVVIRNGASNWKAFQEWDFSFFKNQYGDHPVILSNHKDIGDETEESTVSNLKEIIDGIDHNSMKYARFNPLLDTYPHLQNDLNQTWLNAARDTKIKKHHVLFIGNKGTKTNIHNAGNENIFIQIRGRKRWLLWDQKAHYIFNPEVNRGPAKASPINPNQDYVDENLAYNHLPYYEVFLEPGDIILIPAYLWHYVENLTPTIGIGNRWLSPRNTIRNNPLFAFLEIFNTSPSLFKTLDWRNGFNFNEILSQNKGTENRSNLQQVETNL